MPAGPVTETSRARLLAAGGVEQVLEQPQLLVAADERRLEPVRRGRGRRARQRRATPATPATGAALPLSSCSPAASKAMAADAARWVASPTSTVPGGATDCSRLAVLTRSPATMPWSVAPRVTAASPVRTPARACDARAQAGHRVDELERRADGTLGVVLVRGRRAPDGHHRVADELLDRAAVAPDDLARDGRSSVSAASRVSSASRSSASVVKPTRSANRIDTSRRSAMGAGSGREVGWPLERMLPSTCRRAASWQNFAPAGSAAPQLRQPTARAVPHSRQNLRSRRVFSAAV